MRVFFSHSTSDRAIAELLRGLLHDVFGEGSLDVQYSSAQDAGAGIQPGAQWLPWITDRIREADKTYVLLTPTSMSKPWVLWESGAAAGVALATQRTSPVVPITFGISDDDVPSPLRSAQRVRGDSRDADGITRLLDALNSALPRPSSPALLAAGIDRFVPEYLERVESVLRESTPIAHPLASIPQRFDAAELADLWVACFQFTSSGGIACHADVVELTCTAERQLRAVTTGPEPRTEGHLRPYRSLIEMQLADRHLVGTWRNLGDDRYFGSVHLAVQDGKTLMIGHYTSFDTDENVGVGPWRWVRLDVADATDMAGMRLRDAGVVHSLLENHPKHAGPLRLADVVEPRPG